MQPPIPGGDLSSFKQIETPDSLDMLITSKNHDLKRERIWNAEPEDWLYALVSLQTQEGVMGGGKYGVSRMNGGFGSRSMVGIDSSRDYGFRFRRDVAILRSHKSGATRSPKSKDKISLVWLVPWDGATQIPFGVLHPFYIEICRRVRLRRDEERIHAVELISRKARIGGTETLKGDTNDPWMPVSVEGKAFSVTGQGFSYRKVAELIDPQKYRLPVLAKVSRDDPVDRIVLVAQAVCRGQGRTEGYHERRIPLKKLIIHEDFVAATGRRVDAITDLRLALRLSLLVLTQGGPEKVADRDTSKRFVEPYLEHFESIVDRTFFEAIAEELSAPKANRDAIFQKWLSKQLTQAQSLLLETHQSAPHSLSRRYQARARAEIAFRARLMKSAFFAFAFNRIEIQEIDNASA